MMKPIPATLILICGLFIGWFARGPGTNSENPPAEIKLRHVKRPFPSSLSRSFQPTGLPQAPAQTSEKEFRQWIGKIDESNWQAYLDLALSEEGMSHDLLTKPTIESLEFLHRLGEMSRGQAIEPLLQKKLEFAAAEAMEGWAEIEPREAFSWAKGCDDKYGKVFAKAAGAMIDVDFDDVWKTIRLIRPIAKTNCR